MLYLPSVPPLLSPPFPLPPSPRPLLYLILASPLHWSLPYLSLPLPLPLSPFLYISSHSSFSLIPFPFLTVPFVSIPASVSSLLFFLIPSYYLSVPSATPIPLLYTPSFSLTPSHLLTVPSPSRSCFHALSFLFLPTYSLFVPILYSAPVTFLFLSYSSPFSQCFYWPSIPVIPVSFSSLIPSYLLTVPPGSSFPVTYPSVLSLPFPSSRSCFTLPLSPSSCCSPLLLHHSSRPVPLSGSSDALSRGPPVQLIFPSLCFR